ncbi:MAG: hypothetical protein OEM00_02330 [Burkholderiaceae bacterium]|nr:hypothetical protein [Burkholderiaceae bacterium]
MSSQLNPSRPFPGLQPYATSDHEWFFGRAEPSLALYRLLNRVRFVAVVGGSGSGKSSLVRAGLLPLLAEETAADGGRRWHWWEFSPGDTPMANLVEMLNGGLGDNANDVEGAVHEARRERLFFLLRKSSFGLVDALREIAVEPGAIPIVIVDRFEELFRFADLPGTAAAHARRREEAAAFVQLLLEATRSSDFPIRVILTIRCDDLGDCARFRGLPELVSRGEFLVPSLSRHQFEQAIRGPIEKAGASIADEVVERLINVDRGGAGDERDRLAVLQLALLRMWSHAHRRGSQRLELSDYEAIGEIATAVAQHAEEILAEPELKDLGLAIEQVFRALTQVDRQERGILRPLAYGQLVAESAIPELDVRRVVDRFRRADCSFLVPPLVDDQPLDVEDMVALGHEALIRHWPRLARDENGERRGWVFEEASDGRAYAALLSIARGGATGMSADLPLDPVQARAPWWSSRPRTSAWADRYGGDFDSVEKVFAACAVRQLEAEREAAKAKLKGRLKVSSALIGGIVLPLAAWVYWQFQLTKEQLYAAQQSAASAEQALAALRTEIKPAEPSASGAQEHKAWPEKPKDIAQQRAQPVEKTRAIEEARMPPTEAVSADALSRHVVASSLAALSDNLDRALLLSVAAKHFSDTPESRESLLRALQRAQRAPDVLSGHEASVNSVAFSPDSKVLASVGADRRVMLWDPIKRKALGAPLTGHKAQASSIAFSPDGAFLVSGGADELIFWNVSGHKLLGVVSTGGDKTDPRGKGHARSVGVTDIAFSADGKLLAAALGDTVLLFDASRRAPLSLRLTGHRGNVLSIAFSPDGRTIAAAGLDQEISLWDVAKGTRLAVLKTKQQGSVASIAFSPNGKLLASGGIDKQVTLWDVNSRKQLGEPLKGHEDSVRGVAFSPDNKLIASTGEDGRVILWDVSSRKQFGQPFMGHTQAGVDVAFSPNGKLLASAGDDGRVLLWKVNADDWASMACGIANRNLTHREWKKDVGEAVPYQRVCPRLPMPRD